MKYERKMVRVDGLNELEEVVTDSNGSAWYSNWRLVQVLTWTRPSTGYSAYYVIFERNIEE